ncbi:glycosyltransferase (plasmid) [Shimia sp. W99]
MTRRKPAFFDPGWYLAAYPDVAATGMNPLRHFLRHGRREGRLPCELTAALRERDLRWGMLDGGIDALERLATHGHSRPERVWATLACARRAATEGDWLRADGYLRPLDPTQDLITGFGLPDPSLLAIEAAVMAKDTDRARLVHKLATRTFGNTSDLHLAAANITAATQGISTTWARRMARLFARAGLTGVTTSPGSKPAFDRLRPIGLRLPRQGRQGPLVSVIMPARDAAGTISTALNSLTSQSWRRLEILVVDNGSQDTTRDIVRNKAQADPRIRLLDGSAEPGAYPARNIGLAAAQGALITVMDADDWAHPAKIRLQARALLRNPDIPACVSHWVRTTSDLRFTRWWGDDGLVHRNVSSLMFRAELRDSLGFWDRARVGADTEYYHRILNRFGAKSIIEVQPGLPLSFGRQSAGSLTQSSETRVSSQVYGIRRSYLLAAQNWHGRVDAENALPLPQHPVKRPFDIPEALAIDPPPTALQPTDLIRRSDLFSDHWYMQTYPDLRARNVDGALHYLAEGAGEGRDPGPAFSTTAYAHAHNTRDENPLLHRLRSERGADLLPSFDGTLTPSPDARPVLFFAHQARTQVFGAERSLLDMLDRAAAAGLAPEVVLPQIMNPAYLDALRLRCRRVHVIPYGWLFGGVAPHPATVARLTDLIRRSGVTEIHQNTCVLDAPLMAAREAGVASVVHVRELPAQDPELCRDLGISAPQLRQNLLDLATRFVANSTTVADWINADPSRVITIPNMVDPALFDLTFQPQTPLRVAMIGSLSARKGVADFLAIARTVARRGANMQFILIGPDHPEFAALKPLGRNVVHAGYAATPLSAMEQADIVLSLSKVAESFGRTVLEAMAAGRPVICYDRGTPPALVGPGGAGRVVPADDTDAVATALQEIASSPDLLSTLSKAARTQAVALRRQSENISSEVLFSGVAGHP